MSKISFVDVLDSYSKGQSRERLVKKRALEILKLLKIEQSTLSIVLVGDAKMKKLNTQYLNHRYTTDVVSLSPHKPDELKREISKAKKNQGEGFYLGDLIICLAFAKREAKERSISFEYEWSLYLCHGILHLLGYDDMNARDKKAMFAKQDQILNKLGLHD